MSGNYGSLLNQDAKLLRSRFKEMARLMGVKIQYQYPTKKDYSTQGELMANYSSPVDMYCMIDNPPDLKTAKKLGWNAELSDGALIINLPYDVENLQVGCLITVPSGLDNTPSRKFRISKLSTTMIYPINFTCEMVPEYETKTEQAEISIFKNSNFNLLNEGD